MFENEAAFFGVRIKYTRRKREGKGQTGRLPRKTRTLGKSTSSVALIRNAKFILLNARHTTHGRASRTRPTYTPCLLLRSTNFTLCNAQRAARERESRSSRMKACVRELRQLDHARKIQTRVISATGFCATVF